MKPFRKGLTNGLRSLQLERGLEVIYTRLEAIFNVPRCSKNLTASSATGSNPNKKYHYYHCGGGCKETLPLKKAHELFLEYLKTITIDKNQFRIVKEKIKLKIQKKEKSLSEKKEKFHQKIEKLKTIINRAEDRFFEGFIDPETFGNSKRRSAMEINRCQEKLLKPKHFNRVFEFQKRIEKAKMYTDLHSKFNEANPAEKKTLLDTILSKKIRLFSSIKRLD